MNTKELRVEMLRHGDSNHDLASALETSDATCSMKVNGRSEFSQNQISIIRKRYGLTPERVTEIFFAEEVS